jgi:TRAP-type C4-dicarboxylate transport system substrate-binding protein
MKKLLLVILALVVVAALLLAGCTKETTTTTAAPSTTAASTPVKATKLTFANWMPPPDVAAYSGTFDTWAADFEKLTGGRYDVEVVHGGVLAGVPDSYDAVANGIADIAQFIPQDTDHPFPMMSVVALPFLQVRSDTATKALHKVGKQGFFDKEFAGVKILFFNTSASSDDLITIKPITSLADLKGMKIATGGGSRVDLITALGATPVFCPPPEVYGMLQKGTVEGVMISGYGLYPDHTADFLTCIVNPVRMFRVTHVIAMNLDVYNKMPADVKKIIDDMDKDAKYSLLGAKTLADEYDGIIAKFLGSTGKEVTLNAADTATVEAACADIFKKWMTDMDAKGEKGSEIVKAYYNALKAQGVAKPAIGYTP